MMRIHPISTTVTLLMAAIVLAAPVVVNIILEKTHQTDEAPAFVAQPASEAMLIAQTPAS